MNNFFLTFFYLGKVKYAPGTFASFIVMIFWYFIPNKFYIQFIIILFFLFIGLVLCLIYVKNNEEKDPKYIVIDEAVGMMISLFLIPKLLSLYLLSFIFFRFFDIIKPSIIYRSQNFKNGVGIMLDDVIAGFFSFLVIWNL